MKATLYRHSHAICSNIVCFDKKLRWVTISMYLSHRKVDYVLCGQGGVGANPCFLCSNTAIDLSHNKKGSQTLLIFYRTLLGTTFPTFPWMVQQKTTTILPPGRYRQPSAHISATHNPTLSHIVLMLSIFSSLISNSARLLTPCTPPPRALSTIIGHSLIYF